MSTIMVLGGGVQVSKSGGYEPSPASQRRVDTAFELGQKLLRQEQIPREVRSVGRFATYICSGGYGKHYHEGEQSAGVPAEATVMAAYLLRRLREQNPSYPKGNILEETESVSTVTNFTKVILNKLINPENYNKNNRLTVVTDRFHRGRVKSIARALRLPVEVHTTPHIETSSRRRLLEVLSHTGFVLRHLGLLLPGCRGLSTEERAEVMEVKDKRFGKTITLARQAIRIAQGNVARPATSRA